MIVRQPLELVDQVSGFDIQVNVSGGGESGQPETVELARQPVAGGGAAQALALLDGFDRADPEAGKKVDAAVKGQDRATNDNLNELVNALKKGEFEHMGRQVQNSHSAYAESRTLLLALIVIGFIITGVIVALTIRQIASQIARVQETTEQVRQTLDLTRRIPVIGSDEMAQMATSVNSLLGEFQAVVRRMKDAGSHASHASGELSHSVAQL